MLILVSTVFGAISGVGIWVVAGLVSPGAISALIHTFVWGWAIEWVFFIVEIVAALVYYATWDRVSKGAHLLVGWLYFISAYLSLVIINGIVTFMLTPGRWLETNAFWDGFFNPTYWPSLVLRTGICLMMAAAFMIFPSMRVSPAHRARLARYLGWWMVAGALIAYGGYRWWEAMLPDSALELFRGASPVLATLAETRHFSLWCLTAALVLSLVTLVLSPRLARVLPAILIAVTAFSFFGGYERLREGIRKPFLIHSFMFSNGLRVADIEAINDGGIAAHSGWVKAGSSEAVELGRRVFLAECTSCHTLDGYQGIRRGLPSLADVMAVAADDPAGSSERAFRVECSRCHGDSSAEEMREMLPTPDEIREDPEMILDLNQGMIYGFLAQLHEMGEAYAEADATQMIDTGQFDYSYMPPFVGTDEELEALAAYLDTLVAERPQRVAQRGGGR
jgi:mono/diheme cytochrome c family protein